MLIDSLLKKRGMTKYRLAVDAGIPHATLNDICSGKTNLSKCTSETVYKLAKALDVSMELLTESGILQAERDGLAGGLVLVDRDLYRVHAVRAVEDAERGDAVVGAVAVETGDGSLGTNTIDRDPQLSAVRPEQVVDLAAGSLELER